MENILIFGHKNPDTDTIMSAIAMANLEKRKGNNAKACRLGNINKETKYALEYFKQEEPELIEGIEEGQQVVLVDHNEFGQSANRIENAKKGTLRRKFYGPIKRIMNFHFYSSVQFIGT